MVTTAKSKMDSVVCCIGGRLLDARPDTADFRDLMFVPTLVEVPPQVPLSRHQALKVPVLTQGDEGACTAFALATVGHTLLRARGSEPDDTLLSVAMFYDMARRYDEWQGEDYSGSSCRGAMKGWHRHGVCSARAWPYVADAKTGLYTATRAQDAQRFPLGAYFRVNHKDIVAMHAAFAEVGILYVSAAVHAGWENPRAGKIAWNNEDIEGYHAFAVVGYDHDGFWIQNSWGTAWGQGGYGHITYDDWLAHATDVWVARLAVPVKLLRSASAAISNSALAQQSVGYSQADLRPHIVSLGNNGALRDSGRFASTPDGVRNLIRTDLPAATKDWPKKRILLYAHGGLVPEEAAIQRVADFREALLPQQIYPLCFIWKTDFWTTLGNILKDAGGARTEGVLSKAKDLLLDRMDDTLEPLARIAGGKAMWDEMKENALLASTAYGPDGTHEGGGAALVARLLDDWRKRDPSVEIHIAGHSAGSILMAPVVQLLTGADTIAGGPARGMHGMGGRIASVNLWAPAITVDLFLQTFVPAIEAGAIARTCLFTLTDQAENDDNCAGVYHKSLLYLVAHAFEEQARSWFDKRLRQGTPIAGMARFLAAKEVEDQALGYERIKKLLADGRIDWVQAPTPGLAMGSPDRSDSTSHGGFDDDAATLQATIARILGKRGGTTQFAFRRSQAGLRDRRQQLQRALRSRPRVDSVDP